MLNMVGVSKVYRNNRTETIALDGVDLELEAGQLVLLTGHSGSGKTSLLNVAGCLTRPTTGRVWLAGQQVSALPDHFLSDVRRHAVGFVFQLYNLLPGYTAAENVAMPLIPTGIGEKQRNEKAVGMLDRVGLSHRAHVRVEQLSGGEQQRVAVARALINDPKLILADEPTSNVDPHTELVIISIFLELKKQGKAIIVISHDTAWHEARAPDACYVMKQGRLSRPCG